MVENITVLNRIHNSSLKNKLTLLAMSTSVLTALILYLFFGVYSVMESRKNMLNEMALLANLIGDRNVVAINFDDADLAYKSLSSLQVNHSVILACLYKSDGTVFAHYAPKRQSLSCPPVHKPYVDFRWGKFTIHSYVFDGDSKVQMGSVLIQADMRNIHQQLLSSLFYVFVLVVVVLFLSYELALRMRRLISHPIIELEEATKQVASGKYHVRAKKFYNDDIGTLIDGFNHMVSEVEDAKMNLEVRVKERTFELNQALKAKSDFLSNMSHECRHTVHSIRNLSDLLAHEWQHLTAKEKSESANEIYQSSDRLLVLINNLLDLSKLDAGKMEFEFAKNDLAKVAEEIIAESRGLYVDKQNLFIELQHSKDSYGYFDKEKIAQVLSNLLGNSIKYSEDGLITITIKKTTITQSGQRMAALCCTIHDEGVGIPEEELDHIFGKFNESSYTKCQSGGTGLGLSISKAIIESHNGKVWAENNPDKGATFTFVIPIAKKYVTGA